MFSWRKLFGLSEPAPRATVELAAPAGMGSIADEPIDWDVDPIPEYERYRIARHVVLLLPKEPFVRWIHKSLRNGPKYARRVPDYVKALSNKPGVPTQAELRRTSTTYLIDLDDDEKLTAKEQVERDFVFFFKRELEQWDGTDETHWPTNMTLALFRQWFDIECFDMVLDTAKV